MGERNSKQDPNQDPKQAGTSNEIVEIVLVDGELIDVPKVKDEKKYKKDGREKRRGRKKQGAMARAIMRTDPHTLILIILTLLTTFVIYLVVKAYVIGD